MIGWEPGTGEHDPSIPGDSDFAEQIGPGRARRGVSDADGGATSPNPGESGTGTARGDSERPRPRTNRPGTVTDVPRFKVVGACRAAALSSQ
jgi:hypothetical protein